MQHALTKEFSLIFFLSLILFSNSYAATATTPLPTPVGRVVWIKGLFKALMPNKEERSLQKQSIIYLHDTLVTDDKSQAEIIFTDQSLMTFRAATKFYIDQYVYHPGTKKKSVGKYAMQLLEGGFRTITGLIAKKNPPDYQVNTPVATIGVRGTDYATYVHQGKFYLGFYAGKPCVTNKSNTKNELCLDAKTPYAYVPYAGAAPVGTTKQPDVFKEKLEITSAKIAPFAAPGGGGGPKGGGGGPKGTVSSFCITQ